MTARNKKYQEYKANIIAFGFSKDEFKQICECALKWSLLKFLSVIDMLTKDKNYNIKKEEILWITEDLKKVNRYSTNYNLYIDYLLIKRVAYKFNSSYIKNVLNKAHSNKYLKDKLWIPFVWYEGIQALELWLLVWLFRDDLTDYTTKTDDEWIGIIWQKLIEAWLK